MAKLQSALLLLALVLLIPTSPPTLSQSRERPGQQHPEYLRGVLSRTVLKPPVQGDTEVRFSPDGKYLFIQDGQGIMLILREPLQLITYISAPYTYPARFAPDSKSLILVSYNLAFSKWRVSDGVRMEFRDLDIPDGCLSAALSPTADFLACATSQMVFALYKLESGQKVFSWPLTFRRPPQARSALSIPDSVPVLVRLDVKSAFSSPFGDILENDWKSIANHNVIRLPAWFSPDSKFVIVGNQLEFIRVDLTTLKKENLPSAIQKHFTEIVALQPGDRALTVDEDKHEIASYSLANGKMLSTAALPKDSVHAAQNSRFVLAATYSDQFGRIFDSQTNQFLPAVECVAFDVHDNILASLSVNHSLNFFRLNQATPFLVVHLPLGDLAPLRSAAVSPNLDWLAFSVDGAGGIFQLPSGSPLPDSKPFNGAILSDNKDFVFFSLGRKKSDQLVSRFDFKSRTPGAGWTLAKEGDLHPGQRAFLEYSYGPNSFSGRWLNSGFDDVPFVLHGIDPETGAQLWRQAFTSGVPIPFTDPQGQNFVLAWKAKSDGGKYAMKLFRERCLDCQNAKLSEQDTVFEICHSLTGKPLGAVLVQIGSGPLGFSSVFAAGSALFVAKDEIRLSIYSMENGSLLGHLNGIHPAASTLSGLFVVDEGGGRLAVFDLRTCEKLEEQIFTEEIEYAHFSSDGKRLLVLTQHQEVFILDMSEVREHPLPPPHPVVQPSDDPVNQPQ